MGREEKEDEDDEEEESRRGLNCSRFNVTSRLPLLETHSQASFADAPQLSKTPAQPQAHLRP
jgi:hypothetical protein